MRIEERINRGGTKSFVVRIKVAGMRSPAKAFLVGERYPTKKAAREAAERWGAEQERRLRDEKRRAAVADIATLTVAQLIDAYLADDKTQALRSLRDRRRAVQWWRAEIGPLRCFDEVTAPVIREKRDKLKRGGRSHSTVNRYMRAMSKTWNFGRAASLVPNERVWFAETTLPEPRGRVRFLSDAELAALLQAATAHPHVHAAIMVAIATGLRMGELLRLTWADVSLAEGAQFVAVHQSKTDRPRRVHLPSSAVAALKALRTGRIVSMSGTVFLNELTGAPMNNHHLNNRWRKYVLPAARRAAPNLLKDLRWHDLRHSCASYLAQAGADLHGIATVLGHSNLQTTKRYAHLVEGAALPAHAGLDARLTRGGEGPSK